jgi:hypothetical protein
MIASNNFNDQNARKRSGPMPWDHIKWNERDQRGKITLPPLSFLGEKPEPALRIPTAGDKLRAAAEAARNAAPPLPGRFAIDPALDNRTRSVGTCTIKTQGKGHTGPGQKKLSVKGKGRSYCWTPEMRQRASERAMGNRNGELRKSVIAKKKLNAKKKSRS